MHLKCCDVTMYDSHIESSSSRVKHDAREDVEVNYGITRHIPGRSKDLKTAGKRQTYLLHWNIIY